MAETTFSVGVLGFPGASDRGQLVADIAASFGIAPEAAAQLIDGAPLIVKRGVAADGTKVLVKQLLELGADVSVRNDATGAEKQYLQEPVLTEAPAPHVEPAAPAITTEAERDRTKAMGSVPPPVSGAATLAAAMLAAATRGQKAPSEKPLIESVPPPPLEAPPPLVDAQKAMELCGSCQRPVDRGDVCNRCGWNNGTKARVCRSCKGALELTGAETAPRLLIALAFVVAIAAAVPALLFVGPTLAPAPIMLALAVSFTLTATKVDVRCKLCKESAGERLSAKEKGPLKIARVKLYTAAAAICLAPIGLPIISTYKSPALEASSFGIGWRLQVPRTHRDLLRETRPVRLPDGTIATMSVTRAEPSYFGNTIYAMMSIAIDKPTKNLDLENVLKEGGKGAFEAELGPIHDAQGKGKRTMEATFKGKFHGAPVNGDLRATDFETDVLFVAVFVKGGGAPLPEEADAINQSVEVIRAKR